MTGPMHQVCTQIARANFRQTIDSMPPHGVVVSAGGRKYANEKITHASPQQKAIGANIWSQKYSRSSRIRDLASARGQRREGIRPSDNAAVQHRNLILHTAIAPEPKECIHLRKLYQQGCPAQWVKHFDRKRTYDQFKQKIAKGYEPLNDAK
uniref:Uncharacterized protein n=1 Tax=Anopheles atroparvus TaxID=41427 RepID=A0A182J756_ANOAO